MTKHHARLNVYGNVHVLVEDYTRNPKVYWRFINGLIKHPVSTENIKEHR